MHVAQVWTYAYLGLLPALSTLAEFVGYRLVVLLGVLGRLALAEARGGPVAEGGVVLLALLRRHEAPAVLERLALLREAPARDARVVRERAEPVVRRAARRLPRCRVVPVQLSVPADRWQSDGGYRMLASIRRFSRLEHSMGMSGSMLTFRALELQW